MKGFETNVKKIKLNLKLTETNQFINLFKPLNFLMKELSTNPFPNILFFTKDNIDSIDNELCTTSPFYTFSTFLKSIITFFDKTDAQNVFLFSYRKYITKKVELEEIKNLPGGTFLYEMFSKFGPNLSFKILTKCFIIEKQELENEYKLIIGSPLKLTLTCSNTKIYPQSFFKIFERNVIIKSINFKIPWILANLINEFEAEQINACQKKFEKFKLNTVLKQYFQHENIRTDELKTFIKKNPGAVNNISINHFTISPTRVLNFIFLIVKKTMKSIFDNFNLKIFKYELEKIICGRKRIKWYKTHINGYKITKLNLFIKSKKNVTVFLKQNKIFIETLNLIVTDIIIPILNNHFYYLEIQEGSYSKPKYILKRTSLMFLNFCRNEHEKEMIEINLTEKILTTTPIFIGNSFIKPKEYGYRTLFDMSKPFKPKLISGNQILKQTYLILKQKILNGKTKLINGVYKYEGIFNELRNLDLKDKYIIKIDATRCFDNINRAVIKRLLKEILTEETYKLKFFKKIPERNNFSISEYFINKFLKTEFIKQINNDIFINSPVISFHPNRSFLVTRKELLKNIEILCDKMIIKSKNKYFIRKAGIPQGSNISNILCLLFFAYLDCRFLNKIFKESTIIRYYDDALIISKDMSELKIFLSKKHELAEFGFKFNIEKIETNCIETFTTDLMSNTPPLSLDKTIKWCGLEISNKGISMDFTLQTINFFSYEKPGNNLRAFLDQFLNLRCQRVFFERSNTFKFKNFYKLFESYYKIMKVRFLGMPFINNKLLIELIELPIEVLKGRGLIFNLDIVVKIQKAALAKNSINHLL